MSVSSSDVSSPASTDVPSPTRRKKGMNGETQFMIVALVLILLGMGALYGLNRATNPATTPPPITEEAAPTTGTQVDELYTNARHKKGDAGASLTIVEFADFECPSCRVAFDKSLRTLDKAIPAYRMGFYNYPLPMHERAVPAANAAEAAAKQGKFWEMYDELFDKRSEGLTDELLTKAATKIGLDATRFQADYKNEAKQLINSDITAAQKANVDSTPTFLIRDSAGNVAVLSGARNLDRFLPDLKNGIIGDDKITPPDPQNGQAVTLTLEGKRVSR